MNAETSTTTQNAALAQQGTTSMPSKATATKQASQKKAVPKANSARKTATPKAAKAAKPASKPAAKKVSKPAIKKGSTAAIPREYSKKAIVLDLLRRKDGATMAEIAKATDWQNHSIRGFISGNVSKKMGLAVESTKNDAGERVYHIAGK